MKHYIRLFITLVLISIAAVLFPFGVVAKVTGRWFENYLMWVIDTVERWIKEVEGSQ